MYSYSPSPAECETVPQVPSTLTSEYASNKGSLLASFHEYFELIPALTSQLKEDVFRLRYQVYCEELAFPGFDCSRFPAGLETDEYDERSVHYLMRHRPSGKAAGAVRLVLADPEDPQRPFPVEELAGCYFDSDLMDRDNLPRPQTAEISRLILARDFRRRGAKPSFPVDTDVQGHNQGELDRRHFPHAVLGLLVAVFRMAAEHRITHLYAAMEPPLNRVLTRFRLGLRPIGPLVEYYGLRRPYFATAEEILTHLYREKREVWELLTGSGQLWSPAWKHGLARSVPT